MKPKSIELRIDELVLTGFPPGDRHRLGAAVQQELARLLSEQAPQRSAERRTVHAGTVATASGVGPEKVGHQLAQAVHKVLPR